MNNPGFDEMLKMIERSDSLHDLTCFDPGEAFGDPGDDATYAEVMGAGA